MATTWDAVLGHRRSLLVAPEHAALDLLAVGLYRHVLHAGLHRQDAVGCVYVTDPRSLDAALLPRNQCTEDTPSIFTMQQTDSPLMSLLFSTGGALVISSGLHCGMIIDDRLRSVNSLTQPPTALSHDLRCCLPAACTKLQTTLSIGLEAQKRWFPKKPQKSGLQCLDKPV